MFPSTLRQDCNPMDRGFWVYTSIVPAQPHLARPKFMRRNSDTAIFITQCCLIVLAMMAGIGIGIVIINALSP